MAWLTCGLPDLILDVLAPRTSECDRTWRQSLYRGDQVNIKSSAAGRGDSDPMTGNLETDSQESECHMKMKAEVGVILLQAKEARDGQQPPEVGRGIEQLLPHS